MYTHNYTHVGEKIGHMKFDKTTGHIQLDTNIFEPHNQTNKLNKNNWTHTIRRSHTQNYTPTIRHTQFDTNIFDTYNYTKKQTHTIKHTHKIAQPTTHTHTHIKLGTQKFSAKIQTPKLCTHNFIHK